MDIGETDSIDEDMRSVKDFLGRECDLPGKRDLLVAVRHLGDLQLLRSVTRRTHPSDQNTIPEEGNTTRRTSQRRSRHRRVRRTLEAIDIGKRQTRKSYTDKRSGRAIVNTRREMGLNNEAGRTGRKGMPITAQKCGRARLRNGDRNFAVGRR